MMAQQEQDIRVVIAELVGTIVLVTIQWITIDPGAKFELQMAAKRFVRWARGIRDAYLDGYDTVMFLAGKHPTVEAEEILRAEEVGHDPTA